MTEVERLAEFAVSASYSQLSEQARTALKTHVLDSLGCAIGALGTGPMVRVRRQVETLGGQPLVTLIGGGRTSPDRAALYNSALVRYLDFNDSYLSKGETCHPSDNLGAVLAASEYAGRSGEEFLAALAVAYQVQCRLSEIAPVRARGFDHTTQGAYALAAGISRALGLGVKETSHAIAVSGTSYNALRVSRTGKLSNWKGLAYPNTAFAVSNAVFLAMQGITGPLEIFEGKKGFKEVIAGPFVLDWHRENLEAVRRTILKKYNAEIHSQSALEGILELRAAHRLERATVERIEVEVFDVAYNIIGGGEEGDKWQVLTKEQADHSLPYLVAVALLDGEIGPAQFSADRIVRGDVQNLLRKVDVHPCPAFSQSFPDQMRVRIRIHVQGVEILETEKFDYEGFHTRPMPWAKVVAKFELLADAHADRGLRRDIIQAVAEIETLKVAHLTALLAKVGIQGAA